MPASKVENLEAKRERAAQLHLSGVPYRAIARELGYADASGAKRAVDAWLREGGATREVDAETLRETALLRYEALLSAVWPKALAGDTRSADSATRIVKEITTLQGIEPASRLELSSATEKGYTLVIERRDIGGPQSSE